VSDQEDISFKEKLKSLSFGIPSYWNPNGPTQRAIHQEMAAKWKEKGIEAERI
jgi:hypothetical protein